MDQRPYPGLYPNSDCAESRWPDISPVIKSGAASLASAPGRNPTPATSRAAPRGPSSSHCAAASAGRHGELVVVVDTRVFLGADPLERRRETGACRRERASGARRGSVVSGQHLNRKRTVASKRLSRHAQTTRLDVILIILITPLSKSEGSGHGCNTAAPATNSATFFFYSMALRIA